MTFHDFSWLSQGEMWNIKTFCVYVQKINTVNAMITIYKRESWGRSAALHNHVAYIELTLADTASSCSWNRAYFQNPFAIMSDNPTRHHKNGNSPAFWIKLTVTHNMKFKSKTNVSIVDVTYVRAAIYSACMQCKTRELFSLAKQNKETCSIRDDLNTI